MNAFLIHLLSLTSIGSVAAAQGNLLFPQFLTPPVTVGPGCGGAYCLLTDSGPFGPQPSPYLFYSDPFLQQAPPGTGAYSLIGLAIDPLPSPIDLALLPLHPTPCYLWIDPIVILQPNAVGLGRYWTPLPVIPAVVTTLYVQCITFASGPFSVFYYSMTQAVRVI